jgi:hypothetical protein
MIKPHLFEMFLQYYFECLLLGLMACLFREESRCQSFCGMLGPDVILSEKCIFLDALASQAVT